MACCCGTGRPTRGAMDMCASPIGVEEHVTKGLAALKESLAGDWMG